MKLISLCALATVLGCATTKPFALSEQQATLFQETVRDVEAAGPEEGSPAAQLLAEAKSELEYSQRLPMYPDRARLLADKAQADASKARELAQEEARTRSATAEAARHQILVGAVTP